VRLAARALRTVWVLFTVVLSVVFLGGLAQAADAPPSPAPEPVAYVMDDRQYTLLFVVGIALVFLVSAVLAAQLRRPS
jgi:hypothetical protein